MTPNPRHVIYPDTPSESRLSLLVETVAFGIAVVLVILFLSLDGVH